MFKPEENSGSILILAAVGMIIFFGFLGLVIDVGNMYLARTRMARAADAAALAAVRELPADPVLADLTAYDYASRNGVELSRINVAVGEDLSSVWVHTQSEVPYYFFRLFGYDGKVVGAEARAKTGSVGKMRNVVPLGVEKDNFVFGQDVVLKEGGGDGDTGNYGALALGGKGANVYEENMKHGYPEYIGIGQWLDTETGNMAGKTESGLNYRLLSCTHGSGCTLEDYVPGCPRLCFIPVLEDFNVTGRDRVKVVGFAAFFLDDVGTESGKAVVKGKFVRMAAPGEIDEAAEDYGLKTVQLVE